MGLSLLTRLVLILNSAVVVVPDNHCWREVASADAVVTGTLAVSVEELNDVRRQRSLGFSTVAHLGLKDVRDIRGGPVDAMSIEYWPDQPRFVLSADEILALANQRVVAFLNHRAAGPQGWVLISRPEGAECAPMMRFSDSLLTALAAEFDRQSRLTAPQCPRGQVADRTKELLDVLATRASQATLDALLELPAQALPCLVEHLEDTRPIPSGEKLFAPGPFELRLVGGMMIGDAASLALYHLTGESFGSAATDRSVRAWRAYLDQRSAVTPDTGRD